MVMTPPSHGGIRGSTPLQATETVNFKKSGPFRSTLFDSYGKGVDTLSRREDIEQKTEQLIAPIVSENDFELVDVDFVKEGADYFLRVYIDKPGGITVVDCEAVSREFNVILDEKSYIDVPYIFEVSSPGLTRPLKKEKDFARSIGKRVEFKLYEKVDDRSEYDGILTDFTPGQIVITLDDGSIKTFDRNKLSFIRLAYVEEQ